MSPYTTFDNNSLHDPGLWSGLKGERKQHQIFFFASHGERGRAQVHSISDN